MARSAGRGSDGGLDPVHRRRRDVRAAHTRVVAAEQRAHEIVKPVGIGHAVGVGVGEDFASRRVCADIPRVAQPHVFLNDVLEAGLPPSPFRPRLFKRLHDLPRVILRSVIDKHDLEIRIIQPLGRFETFLERLAAVVAAYDHRNARILPELHPLRHRRLAREFFLQRVKRLFRIALARHQTERPVRDFRAAGEPFIRPRKHNRPRRAAAHDALHMPAEHLRLLVLGVADRVHAEFAEDQRLVLREILQPREVAVEVALFVEIDVEGEKIDVLRKQILGGRITRVAVKRARIGRACDADELLDKLRDAPRAEPAHDARRDFVSDEVGKNRVVSPVLPHRLANRADDLRADFPVVQKLDVLRPRNRNHRAHPELPADVEQPFGRDMVDADEVHPHLAHQREILADALRRGQVVAVRVRLERSVGRPFQEKLPLPFEEKLRTDADGIEWANLHWRLKNRGFRHFLTTHFSALGRGVNS